MAYEVIYIDPPWEYYGSPVKWAAAGKFYPLMTEKEIGSLPISSLLSKSGVVFLWATGPKLDVAIRCIEKWGLFYRGVGFVWVKTKRDGTPIGAQGVRPSIVKPLTEFVLCASKKKSGRPMPLGSESVVQTVFAPRERHSQKPEEVRLRIESLYPGSKKLEMFARELSPDWDSWGDEVVSVDLGL